MTKYQQFLNKLHIIPEDLFNDIIKSLPEVNIDDVEFEVFDADSLNYVANSIISSILYNWNYVFPDCVDVENKTMELCDVESLKDLEEIKNTFTKWTIINYDELVKELQ